MDQILLLNDYDAFSPFENIITQSWYFVNNLIKVKCDYLLFSILMAFVALF